MMKLFPILLVSLTATCGQETRTTNIKESYSGNLTVASSCPSIATTELSAGLELDSSGKLVVSGGWSCGDMHLTMVGGKGYIEPIRCPTKITNGLKIEEQVGSGSVVSDHHGSILLTVNTLAVINDDQSSPCNLKYNGVLSLN